MVARGDLALLKWAREEGCPYSERTFKKAAKRGDIEILKYLRETGCPWDNMVVFRAARAGKFEALWWMRENGFDSSSALCGALQADHVTPEILTKILEIPECLSTQFLTAAMISGNLESVKWAYKKNPQIQIVAWTVAAKKIYSEILKWLHAQSPFPVSPKLAIHERLPHPKMDTRGARASSFGRHAHTCCPSRSQRYPDVARGPGLPGQGHSDHGIGRARRLEDG
jgi:hypothetical protein